MRFPWAPVPYTLCVTSLSWVQLRWASKSTLVPPPAKASVIERKRDRVSHRGIHVRQLLQRIHLSTAPSHETRPVLRYRTSYIVTRTRLQGVHSPSTPNPHGQKYSANDDYSLGHSLSLGCSRCNVSLRRISLWANWFIMRVNLFIVSPILDTHMPSPGKCGVGEIRRTSGLGQFSGPLTESMENRHARVGRFPGGGQIVSATAEALILRW